MVQISRFAQKSPGLLKKSPCKFGLQVLLCERGYLHGRFLAQLTRDAPSWSQLHKRHHHRRFLARRCASHFRRALHQGPRLALAEPPHRTRSIASSCRSLDLEPDQTESPTDASAPRRGEPRRRSERRWVLSAADFRPELWLHRGRNYAPQARGHARGRPQELLLRHRCASRLRDGCTRWTPPHIRQRA